MRLYTTPLCFFYPLIILFSYPSSPPKVYLWFIKFRNLLDFVSILPVLISQSNPGTDLLLTKSTVFHHVLRLAHLVRVLRVLSFLQNVQAIDLMFKIIDDVYHSTRGKEL